MGLFKKDINEVFGDSPGETVYYSYFDDPVKELIALVPIAGLLLMIALFYLFHLAFCRI